MCNNCNQNNCIDCIQEVHICNQCPITELCDCAVKDLNTDCSVFTGDSIECDSIVVVAKNTILSDALSNIVSWSCTKFSNIENFFRIINTGTGAEIFSGINLLGEKKLRKIKSASSIITVTQNTDDISLGIDSASLDSFIEVNQKTYSISNTGTGAQVYKDSTVVANNTQFNVRKIKSSNSSVTITEATDDIDVTIVVDTVITDGSLNPITSNAVFDALATGVSEAKYEAIVIPISDLITNLTTGVTKGYFPMPFSAVVNSVKANVLVPQTAGSILTFDINENGVSILSTKLTIDNNEKTSLTASTPSVISDTSLSIDSEITFDIDQIGTEGAKGAVITLIVTRV